MSYYIIVQKDPPIDTEQHHAGGDEASPVLNRIYSIQQIIFPFAKYLGRNISRKNIFIFKLPPKLFLSNKRMRAYVICITKM